MTPGRLVERHVHLEATRIMWVGRGTFWRIGAICGLYFKAIPGEFRCVGCVPISHTSPGQLNLRNLPVVIKSQRERERELVAGGFETMTGVTIW